MTVADAKTPIFGGNTGGLLGAAEKEEKEAKKGQERSKSFKNLFIESYRWGMDQSNRVAI